MNMKNILKMLCAAMVLPAVAFSQESSYVLEGKAPEGLKKVYLTYYDFNTNEPVIDSAVVNKGKFAFAGEFGGASYAGLYFRNDYKADKSKDPVKEFWFFMNEGKTVVDATQGRTAKLVDGSPLVKEYIASEAAMQKVREQFNAKEYQANVLLIDSLQLQVKKLQAKQRDLEAQWEAKMAENRLDFVKKNPDNTLSLVYLEGLEQAEEPKYDIDGLFNSLSERIKTSSRAKRFQATLRARALGVGGTAFDFQQNDPNGKPVKLSDFKGKYVLIDFWASWCVPCRKENPHVVAAYEKYKGKNFEILGVSLDADKASWLKAIKDDGLTWTNVSDLKGWKNEVGELYAVKAVPSNFLISPEGKILAKDLRGDALIQFLEKNL